MAFWGNGVSSQIITVANQESLRGSSGFACGAWVQLASYTASTLSFWRQDGTFTPIQYDGANEFFRPAWWEFTGNLLNFNAAATTWYGNAGGGGAFPLTTWVYVLLNYARSGIVAYTYRPGVGVVQHSGGTAWASTINADGPTGRMRIGGTEDNAERMRSGDAIAELTILSKSISPAIIPALAHDPGQFRGQMRFYCPLRDPARNHTERVGGRSYQLSYGTTSRAQILPGQHPPVQEMRTKSR